MITVTQVLGQCCTGGGGGGHGGDHYQDAAQDGASRPVFRISLLALYGVGHCAVIVAAGTFTDVVQRYLNWNERFRGGAILRSVCGLLVSAGGVYLIYTAR